MTRVLIVEDSATQAAELRAILEAADMRVERAVDGVAALAAVEGAPPGQYDLVISDVVMPRMDGYELCRRLKESAQARDLPVILLTTLADPMDIVQGLACGADNFLTKPYEPAYLVRRIEQVLANKTARGSRRLNVGAEILLMGRRVTVTSEREQILDLLISTFEELLRTRERELQVRLSEEAVRESQRLLESTLDALSAHIAVLDGAGNVIAVNEAWRQADDGSHLLGRPCRVGESYLDACASASRGGSARAGVAAECVRSVMEGARAAAYAEHECACENARHWLSVQAKRLPGPGSACVVIAHEDVTERRRAASRQATQLAVTRALADSGSISEAAPRLLPAACEVVGAELGELWTAAGDDRRQRPAGAWHADVRELAAFAAAGREAVAESLDSLAGQQLPAGTMTSVPVARGGPALTRGPLAEAAGLRHALFVPLGDPGGASGALVFFSRRELAPSSADVVATLVDAAVHVGHFLERIGAEVALANQTRILRSVLDSLADGVVVANASGRCVLVNAAAARLAAAGVIEAAPGAACLVSGAHGIDGQAPLPARDLPLARAVRGEPSDDVEVVVRNERVERPVHLAMTGRPLRDETGSVTGGVLVVRDVTARKDAQETLRETEAQLRQAQKMEAVGRLAGGVAHDFNNLLTVIASYSDMAMQGLPADDRRRHDIEQVRRAGERAAALTRQLLAFSRRQLLQPVVLDLNSLMADTEKMLRRLIGEDIDLVTSLARDLGPIKADPGQVEQVLLNLVVNSRDAMPKGGKLTIVTANADVDAAYAANHLGVPPGPYVMVAVSDTGCGMDEATKARIFEPFFTTKAETHGTGLGLSTVHGIVEQSGGHVFVYSEVGHGTTFKIYFPRAGDATAGDASVRGAASHARGTETVLVVEDQDDLRELVARVLAEAGYDILTARNGAEALGVAEGNAGRIALLLTDVVMPEVSGRQLADALKRRMPSLRVLFMSGYTNEAVVHHGVLAPGVILLQKPFTPQGLLAKVREVLDAAPP